MVPTPLRTRQICSEVESYYSSLVLDQKASTINKIYIYEKHAHALVYNTRRGERKDTGSQKENQITRPTLNVVSLSIFRPLFRSPTHPYTDAHT